MNARRDDWADRLHAAVAAWPDRDLDLGRHDCALFAAHCLDAMTDSDWSARLSAEYVDEVSARALLDREGGLEAAVTARLGAPVAPLCACRGDVCLVPSHDDVALGVCLGAEVAALVDGRVALVPLASVIKAWRT